ncbi:unnamed protein product [Closterium sp. NIES-54]
MGMFGNQPAGVPWNPPTGTPGNPPVRVPGNSHAGIPGNPPAGLFGNPPAGIPGNPRAGTPGNPPAGIPGNPPTGTPGNPPASIPGSPPAGTLGNPPAGIPGNPPTGTPKNPPAGIPWNGPGGLPEFVLPAVDLVSVAIAVVGQAALRGIGQFRFPPAFVPRNEKCDRADGLSLFDLTSGASPAPPTTADSTVRSQWATRDATARLAVRRHLPTTECAHFSQYRSAQSLYDALVAHYSSPATTALSRLILPYLFPDLAAFPTVADLITQLRTSDTRYRAALPAEFCAQNPPPMYITL